MIHSVGKRVRVRRCFFLCRERERERVPAVLPHDGPYRFGMLVSPRIQVTVAFPYASPHRGTVSYGYPTVFSVVFFKTISHFYMYMCILYIHVCVCVYNFSVSTFESRRRKKYERDTLVERGQYKKTRSSLSLYLSHSQHTKNFFSTAKYSFAPASGEI